MIKTLFFASMLSVSIPVLADDGGTVPPPGSGSIRLVGTPGLGQVDRYHIARCETDPKTIFKHHSCDYLAGTFQLNTAYNLPEGTYRLAYNYTASGPVVIAPNKETSLSLSKITIGRPQTTMSISVFLDLSNPEQRTAEQLYWWSLANVDFWNIACGFTSYDDVCQSQVDPISEYNACHKIRDNSSVSNIMLLSDGGRRRWSIPQRYQVAPTFSSTVMRDSSAFVSVFPGIYAVSFIDQQTNIETVRSNIVIK